MFRIFNISGVRLMRLTVLDRMYSGVIMKWIRH